jgi:uncharacterized membrane protein
LENEVVKNISENEFITENTNASINDKTGIGDIIADKVPLFGGSWKCSD